jgi:lysophospholipase L1-like esterase
MRLSRPLGSLLVIALGACSDSDAPSLPDKAGSSGALAGMSADAGRPAANSGNGAGGSLAAGSGRTAGGQGGASGRAGSGGSGVSGGAGASGQAAGAGGSGERSPGVRYVGRVDLEDSRGGKFAWSGSGIVARFNGTAVSVRLSGGQEFSVVLDGELRPSKLTIQNGDTPIADALPSGTHTLELYRRTEANQGVSQFLGFSFGGGGSLLAAPSAPSRRLELIGDSISVGYGNEGLNENCQFTPQTENHHQSFGAMAARSVEAELHTIAWSGRGMVCNYGDDAQSCKDPFPNIYDRTIPTQNDSEWDFGRYQPDAVVINLGTNDYSTDLDPSEADFTAAYRAFIEHVRSVYPNALILCTCGPLLYGDELTAVRHYIANAVAATGDAKVKTFEIPSQSAADGLGCDYHPSIKTHQKMADLLVAVLKRELSW